MSYDDTPNDTLQSDAMRKLFVGGLSRQTVESTFEGYFSQFGDIEDACILKDPNTNSSRGFGFVTYKNSDSIEEVFKGRPHTLDGKEVETKRAMPREFNTQAAHIKTARLFVGGFKGTDLEPERLRSYLEERHPPHFGGIVNIDFLTDKATGLKKGFGFIDCSGPDFADRIAISENSFTLDGRTMSIKKAEPKGSKDQEGGGSGRGQGGGPMRRGGGGSRSGSHSGGGYQQPQSYNSGGYNQGSYNQGGYNQGSGYNQGGGYNQGSYGGGYQNSGYSQGGYSNQSYGNQGSYGGNTQQQSGGYGGGYNQGYGSGGYQQGGYDQSYGGGYNQSGGGGGQRGGRSGGGGQRGGGSGGQRYQPY